MEFNFINISSLIYIVISVLFALYLFLTKKKSSKSNVLFALLLIISAVDVAAFFNMTYLFPVSGTLGMLLSHFVFLEAPLLYLYFISVMYADFKYKPSQLLHLLPYIGIIVLFYPQYYSLNTEEQVAFLTQDNNMELPIIRISYIALHIQAIVYFAVIFLKLRRYKMLMLENYTDKYFYDLKWLMPLFYIKLSVFAVATFKNVFMFFLDESLYNILMIITMLFGLVGAVWIIFKALESPYIFSGISSDLELSGSIANESEVTGKKGIIFTSKEEQIKINKLKAYIEENEPYLNSDLTIYDLAKELGMSSKELSVLINQKLKKHFFDFINGYRIEKAKEILEDDDKKDFTILEILYEVGFNSKSSFNTAFKKHTGLTPTEYRKTCSLQVA